MAQFVDGEHWNKTLHSTFQRLVFNRVLKTDIDERDNVSILFVWYRFLANSNVLDVERH